MNNQLLFLEIFLLAINLLAFFLMHLDKMRSKKSGTERIPEGVMFFAAAAFGSIGILTGMYVFRHKTAKWEIIVN